MRDRHSAAGTIESRLLWALLGIVLGGVLVSFMVTRLPSKIRPTFTVGQADLPVYGQVADFSLVDQLGREVGRADFAGRPWVADFIFTRCAGPCPLLTGNMARVAESLGPDSPVRFASFSIDPEEDTPAVLKAYAGNFGADPSRWRFLTGDRRIISDLAFDSFHLAVEMPESGAARNATSPDSGGLRDIPHTLRFALVDAECRIRGYYDGTDPDAITRLKRDVGWLLKRGS